MQTFKDLTTAWIARREHVEPISPATATRARHVLRDIGKMPLNAPLESWLDWIATMRARRAAPSTVSGRITTALAIARQARLILRDMIPPDRVPVELIEQTRDYARLVRASGPSRARHRSATPEELNRLITAAQDRGGAVRLDVIIPFAVATALRRSELLRITWADIDPASKTMLIRNRKDPRRPTDQRIPLSPTALAILRNIGPGHPQRRIFPHQAGTLSDAFKDCARRAGLPDLMFKDLRSTAAQQLFNRGWTADQVATVTGHRTIQILLAHYASAEPERMALRLASEERKIL